MMSHRRVVRSAVALLLLLAGGGAPAALAQDGAPPQDPLSLATRAGRYLFAYDQAASRATTMLLTEGADTTQLNTYAARQHPDEHWTVGFGRLSDEGGFRLAYEVVLNAKRRVDSVRTFEPPQRLAPDSYYARAARAQRLVREDVEAQHPPYNLLVLPAGSETGRLTVYVVPAQTNPEAYRLGGDYRYEVEPGASAGAARITSQTALHKGFYRIGTLPEDVVGSAHRAARPVETDVLFATLRRPKAPHFVMSGQQVFRIAPDGSITPMPAGTFEQRDEVKVFPE